MSQQLYELNHRNFKLLFEKNKNKNWDTWLKIDIDLSEKFISGKQGYTGTLKSIDNESVVCVYKISKDDDNLIEHEFNTMITLESLSKYCFHFHQSYGILPFECNVHYISHPLVPQKNHKCVQRQMLLMQYIPTKFNLRDFLDNETISDEQIIYIIKQILLAIQMAQDYKFTHYDLHSQNILLRNCNPNSYILYVLKPTCQILIPTYGYIANIIDFGFSFIENENKTMTCTLLHTKQGFLSTRYDPISDFKLFLITLTDDIHRSDRKKLYEKLHTINRNLFSGANIQWATGWDNSKQLDPVTLIHNLVQSQVKDSVLFSKENIWFDTFQQLIQLPLSALPYHDLETAMKSFISEFIKFEDRIASKTLLNYILKIFIKYVKLYRSNYLNGDTEESNWAVFQIKKNFLDDYMQIINYHNPSIDYDKLICSTLLLSQCIEGLIYESLQKRFMEKDNQNDIIRIKSIEKIFKIIDINFDSKQNDMLKFKNKTCIYVIDHIRKQNNSFTLDQKNIHEIHKFKNFKLITKYIYNLYLTQLL